MKIKTSELKDKALDWAVAKCLGWEGAICKTPAWAVPLYIATNDTGLYAYAPSSDWAQGGPILSRERISRTIDHSGLWIAYWTDGYVDGDEGMKWMQCDRSELVAGLRCYVASKLGNDVDVPEELL